MPKKTTVKAEEEILIDTEAEVEAPVETEAPAEAPVEAPKKKEKVFDAETATVAELMESMKRTGFNVDPKGLDGSALVMLRKLAAQPKTTFMVPLDQNETLGSVADPVIMNGLRLNIMKGLFIEVPRQVAEHLQESFYQTQKAVMVKTVNPITGQESYAAFDYKSADAKSALS